MNPLAWKINIVDNDVIEITNLTRQFFLLKQNVGLPKTTVLRRELTQSNSQSEVTELHHCKRRYKQIV
nr:ThiF family adenylyltransferase [Bartonella callosciuri]